MLSPEYIAGILDGEGSFSCQIKYNNMNTLRQISPRIMIGFKQSEKETSLINTIQKELGVGKIYISNDGKENGIVRWMTITPEDVISMCEKVLPYLQLKQDQCRSVLDIAKIIRDRRDRRYINGYKTKLSDIYTKEELTMIIKSATTMNASRQVNKYRNTLGRNTDYYLEMLDRMYT